MGMNHPCYFFDDNIDEDVRKQILRCLVVSGEEAKAVVCADNHKGYGMPIGGVIASQTHVMPAGVGFDIGCGNLAVRTTLNAKDIALSEVMNEIVSKISFGVGRSNNEPIDDHFIFDSIANSPSRFQRSLLSLAQNQLGTVGSGNHYVDLFEDRADGRLWIGVHFGSRGFGHKTASYYLEQSGSTDESMDAIPVSIPIDSPLAQEYLEAMRIAGNYAYAGRDWVVERVLSILGAMQDIYVHNHHNYAWWEVHGGEGWLVTRKGATPALPGQQGFVGGSMGDDAVIVEGVDGDRSQAALYSTVHGAGRVMGRMEARGKWKNGVCIREPRIDWAATVEQLKSQGVELRGGGADEAPGAYKRLPEVLAHHGDTIKILHTLRPIGVAMAGANEVDPYKD
jgi:tRNA-splicing ligase RtcB